MNEIAETRVTIHAPTAAPLTSAVRTAAGRPPRISVSRPTATWAAATATISRDNAGCSAWTPIAAAWTRPAPMDAEPTIWRKYAARDRPCLVAWCGGAHERVAPSLEAPKANTTAMPWRLSRVTRPMTLAVLPCRAQG